MGFFLLLFMLLFSLCSSDSSDLSVLWFIEMYCWKCTGQGFLPTTAGLSLLFSLFSLCGSLPLSFSLQSCRAGGGSPLFYLLAVGVCARVCMREHAGEAADAGDDDQDDE